MEIYAMYIYNVAFPMTNNYVATIYIAGNFWGEC